MLGSSGLAQPVSRFVPPSGKKLLIIGQDLGAIGGFSAPNNDGYTDSIDLVPGGFTTYTSLPWMLGLKTKVNLGAGDTCAQEIIDNPKFKHSVLSIGLWMVDQEQKIANGQLDERIQTLAHWIASAKRPVLLRIGYEFDGSWNHYEPVAYKQAFQRIVTKFRELKVENCAFVWQAATSPFNGQKDLNAWYPGDEFVDWVGYSWFLNSPEQISLTDELLSFARKHRKPVMVCESAPQGYDIARLTRRNITTTSESPAGGGSQDKTAEQIWKEWFVPYFDYLDNNRDVIQIVSYINTNWDTQAMWGRPYKQGYWGDSRVETNPELKRMWQEKISGSDWSQASPALFENLGYK